MASPAKPSIQIRYSSTNFIRGPADLDKVNEKLLNLGYTNTRIGCVTIAKPCIVDSTTKHPDPSGSDVLHIDETVLDTSETLSQKVASSSPLQSSRPESMNLTSPDSDLPCEPPDCPIKDIPHNIGRYFHNGEQYKSPSTPSYETTLAGSMEDVRNAFNRTVPPPEIVTAYINIRKCAGEATNAELDMVRGYQKHHMWRPVVSEVSTPWPRCQYPQMHGLHGQMPEGNEMYLASDGITSIFDRKRPIWSVDAVDKPVHYSGSDSFSSEQDSDDEDYILFPPLRIPSSDGRSTRPLLSPVTEWSDDEKYDDGDDEVSHNYDTIYGPDNHKQTILSTTKEVKEREIMSDEIQLQGDILRQIADMLWHKPEKERNVQANKKSRNFVGHITPIETEISRSCCK